MASPFVGQIELVAFNFAPQGWAFCDGQLLPISQNTALFSLLGTYYGGDGKSTFALPNMQGNMAVGVDYVTGQYSLGEITGSQSVTLLTSEIPAHVHAVSATTTVGHLAAPGAVGQTARVPGNTGRGKPGIYGGNSNLTTMSALSTNVTGGDQPHNNMMPFLTLNYIIALQGIYPPR